MGKFFEGSGLATSRYEIKRSLSNLYKTKKISKRIYELLCKKFEVPIK